VDDWMARPNRQSAKCFAKLFDTAVSFWLWRKMS
jgi:hypothetical protein